MQDNSDIQHKVRIRHETIKALGRKPGLVLDLCAGEGLMTRLVWTHNAERVICVEPDAHKAALITGAEIIIGRGEDSVHLAEEADIIDCDAYGLVMPMIESIPPGKLIVFTDGTPEKARKVWRANIDFERALRRLLRDFVLERSAGGNALYGWGWRR